jgi:hypothetical protein
MISRELTGFLEQGLDIHIATRDGQLQAWGARAVAASVSADGLYLTVFVPEVAADRVLQHLEANGQAAVVFGRPTDDRACQVKGVFHESRRASVGDRGIVEAQWEACLRQFERIGIPRITTEGWATWPAVAVTLKATALFEQSPGPQAGTPLA